MTLEDICTLLEGEFVVGTKQGGVDVTSVGATDLMSDALAFMQPGALMLTGLCNVQVVRTAEMADLKGICFVRGKEPGDETLAAAREDGIPVITTPFPMYKACGLLWEKGLEPCF